MEDIVDLPQWGQSQAVDYWRDYICDRKGAIAFWGELLGWVTGFKVVPSNQTFCPTVKG
jgi:hypothetical protein